MVVRKILFFLCVMVSIVSANSALAAAEMEQWQLVSAEITLVKNDGKELKTEGTVFGKLLEQNKRSLWSMKEEDGSILSLYITYKVKEKNTFITQIGFYRTFDPIIMRALEAKGIFRKTVIFDIAYLKNNPLVIRFYIKGNLVAVPPLLTKNG